MSDTKQYIPCHITATTSGKFIHSLSIARALRSVNKYYNMVVVWDEETKQPVASWDTDEPPLSFRYINNKHISLLAPDVDDDLLDLIESEPDSWCLMAIRIHNRRAFKQATKIHPSPAPSTPDPIDVASFFRVQ